MEEFEELELNSNVIDSEIEGNDDCADEETNLRLYTQINNISIESLKNKYERGKLDLSPDYQRNYVMKKTVASRLIESILLNIPIPVIYLAEEEDGSWVVIDGKQRLTSIISFINGKFITDGLDFKLTGLKMLSELNGKLFSQLSADDQEKIFNSSLNSVVISKDSDENVKFEIFERLNTGSVPLNEDEIRNNIYRGTYTELLAKLEEDDIFNKIVDKPNYKKRMFYRGMILRFFAFYEQTYLKYKPSMKTFCNKHLKTLRYMDENKQAEYEHVFKDTVSMVYSVFGKNAFRRLVKDSNSNNYKWSNTRINMALFDVEMGGFSTYVDKKELVYKHADEIRDAMYNLMLDEKFVESIEMKTSNTYTVEYRFDVWRNALKEILHEEKINPRCFPYEIKEKLFNNNPTCALCGQQILSIDDAQVDHIKPFSLGGETIFENAQLAHRYCNQHKGNKND